jgi:hypothetical protein
MFKGAHLPSGKLTPWPVRHWLLAKVDYGYTAWHAAAESKNLKVLEALWSWAKEAQLKQNELSELLATPCGAQQMIQVT